MIRTKITYRASDICDGSPKCYLAATGHEIVMTFTDAEGKNYYLINNTPDKLLMPERFESSTLEYRAIPFFSVAREGIEADILDYFEYKNERIVVDVTLVGVKEQK